MPVVRKLMWGLELLSAPNLLEPIFLCEITAPIDCKNDVYKSLEYRRGKVV